MTGRAADRRRARRAAVPALAAAVALLAGACSSGSAPEVPAGPDGSVDQELALGRDVYSRRCASCHGASGGGSRGPKLSEGRAAEQYPDVQDQIQLVAEGRGGMPAFGDVLDEAELEAVVRYTREVL